MILVIGLIIVSLFFLSLRDAGEELKWHWVITFIIGAIGYGVMLYAGVQVERAS